MMKLEIAPVEDNSGIAQIQAQLAAMALELRDMKKGKPSREEVWCTQFRTEGHGKEQCHVVRNYLNTGAPNPFNPNVLYCEICRTTSQHRPEDCYLLQRYVQVPKNPYCKFCNSVGHKAMMDMVTTVVEVVSEVVVVVVCLEEVKPRLSSITVIRQDM